MEAMCIKLWNGIAEFMGNAADSASPNAVAVNNPPTTAQNDKLLALLEETKIALDDNLKKELGRQALYEQPCDACGKGRGCPLTGQAPKMKECGSCLMACYCNAACRKADWKNHKAWCRLLKEARESDLSMPVGPHGMSFTNIKEKTRSFHIYYGRIISCYIDHRVPLPPSAPSSDLEDICLMVFLTPSPGWDNNVRKGKAAFTVSKAVFTTISLLPSDDLKEEVERYKPTDLDQTGLPMAFPIIYLVKRQGEGAHTCHVEAVALDLDNFSAQRNTRSVCTTDWSEKCWSIVNKQEGVTLGDLLCSCSNAKRPIKS